MQDVLYNLSYICTTDKSVVMQQAFHFVCYIRLCQLAKTEDFHDAVFTFVHQMCLGSGMNTSQLICLIPLSNVMCMEYHSHGHLRLECVRGSPLILFRHQLRIRTKVERSHRHSTWDFQRKCNASHVRRCDLSGLYICLKPGKRI